VFQASLSSSGLSSSAGIQIDDKLLFLKTQESFSGILVALTVDLLEQLRFMVNQEKSQLSQPRFNA